MPEDPFGHYTIEWGETLWQEEAPVPSLIEGVLWQGDVVMLLGSEKAGKSILGLQMAFNLTTGSAFLDKYPVVTPVPVLLIQTEGKKHEFRARMRQMAEATDVVGERFFHLFRRFLPLDHKPTMDALLKSIEQLPEAPKVIFIDSLYTSMGGDLIDNMMVRQLLAQLSRLINRFNCALVIIHHETKEQWEGGRLVERGDQGSYGSVFLRAWVDHILYLKRLKDQSRTLTCNTQRSGRVFEQELLHLLQPVPLLFEVKSDQAPATETVYQYLMKRQGDIGLSREEMVAGTRLSMSSVEKALRHLLMAQRVKRDEGKPRRYVVRV